MRMFASPPESQGFIFSLNSSFFFFLHIKLKEKKNPTLIDPSNTLKAADIYMIPSLPSDRQVRPSPPWARILTLRQIMQFIYLPTSIHSHAKAEQGKKKKSLWTTARETLHAPGR